MYRLKIFFYIVLFPFIYSTSLTAQELLTLDDCIRIGLKQNPDYLNAQANVAIANAGVNISRSRVLPQFNSNASATQSIIGPANKQVDIQGVPFDVVTPRRTQNDHRSSVQISQLLYDGGGWWNEIKRANRNVKQNEFAELSSKENTIFTIKQNYFTLLKEQKQVEAFQQAVKYSEDNYKSAQARYDIGVAAQIDVYQALNSLNSDKLNLLNQEQQVELSKTNLNLAMGREVDTPVTIADISGGEEMMPTVNETYTQAMDNNPAIKQRYYAMEAAKYDVKIQKSGLLPTISSNVRYSRSHPTSSEVYGKFDRNYYWNYNVSLSWNLFNGFRTMAGIQQAKLREDQAEESYRDVQLQLKADVRGSYLNLESNNQKLELLEESLVFAEESYRLAQERYNVGAGTQLDVLNALANLTRDRIIYIHTKYDIEIEKARLAMLKGENVEEY